jgi:hypothetical protein
MKSWLQLMESVAPETVEEDSWTEVSEGACSVCNESPCCCESTNEETDVTNEEELTFEDWSVVYDSVNAKNVKANVRMKSNMQEAEVREWFQRVFSPMGIHEMSCNAKKEDEQIDELSKDTVRTYYNKAGEQGKEIADRMKMGGGDWSADGSDTKTLAKRAAGRTMALKRRSGEMKMSEEQVDEFSLGDLGKGNGNQATGSSNIQTTKQATTKVNVNGKAFSFDKDQDAKQFTDKVKKGEIAVEAKPGNTSQWGTDEELLRNVAQVLEREVEWPLTELLPRQAVGNAMQPIQDLVQSALNNLPTPVSYESLDEADRNEQGMFKDLSDAYEPGPTEVWYWKDDMGRDMMMGKNFLIKQNKMPDPANLAATHVKLGSVKETNPEKVFHMMQGEMWSPEGQARSFIQASGTGHTSMSVGDIVVVNGKAQMVDRFGFTPIDNAPAEESVMEGKFHAGRAVLAEAHEVKLMVNDDHEVRMAQAELYRLAKDAIALHNLLDQMGNLEGWVSSKITLATDYVATVRDYIDDFVRTDGENTDDQLPAVVPGQEPAVPTEGPIDMPTEAADDDWDQEEEEPENPDADKIPHIVMQLKKAADVGGNYPITFKDGSKHVLPYNMIASFLTKYMEKKPFEREAMQDQAGQSLLDLQATMESMEEAVVTNEKPIDVLAKVVADKQASKVKFDDGGSIMVDLFSASAMMGVYHNLKKEETKAKFRNMVNNKAGFLKLLDFALSKK